MKMCSEPVSDPKQLFQLCKKPAKSLLQESDFQHSFTTAARKEGGSPNLAAAAANFPSGVIHLTWVGLAEWRRLVGSISLGFKVFIT